MHWWLYALDSIDKNKESADELLKKVDSFSTKSTTGLGTAGISSRSAQNFVRFVLLAIYGRFIILFRNL
jgi:hypothetical protein